MKDKVHLIFDKNKSSLKMKSFLIKKIQITSLKNANTIIVLGGDGFMLQTLKKFYKYKKPFYGINSGNYGFLMNKFSKKNFLRNLKNSNFIKIQANKKISFELLYDKNNSLHKKIKIEQTRKETSNNQTIKK